MLNLSEFSQGRCLNVLLIHTIRGLEIQRNKHREIRKQGRTNVQHKTSVDPGRLPSRVRTSGFPPVLSTQRSLNGADDGAFLRGSSCRGCRTKRLTSSLHLSHGFAAWRSTCCSAGAKLLVLGGVDACTSSSCPRWACRALQSSPLPAGGRELAKRLLGGWPSGSFWPQKQQTANWPHSAFIGVSPGMNHQNYIVLPPLFFFQAYDLQSNDIFTKEVKCVAFLESMCCLIDLKYYVCMYVCMNVCIYLSIYLVVLVLFHFCKQRIWVILAVWVCGHNIWYIILLMIDKISY